MAIKKNIDVHSNIKAMQINIPKISEPVLHTYKYDQLNRIKAVNNYNSYNTGTNAWTSTNAHKETLSFDANGNIQTALLNGNAANLPYENLTYTYDGVKKNRLLSIHNSVDNVTSEYEYDAIGNVTKDELEGNENMQWNVYGKLKSLEKMGSGTAISFGYDAAGNRISKKVGTTKQQWYVRDASGNIMATYVKDNSINGGDLSTEMFNMYGSSMLGAWKLSTNMEVPPLTDYGELERGNQEFYFSNQLGNNLVILSDRKEGIQDTENPTQVVGYNPHVLSATDYSAYGENLIGREYNATGIKFGFNGKWNDFETGYQDYGARMYSSKKRGFNGIDPMAIINPGESSYTFAGNSPVALTDFDGLFKISPYFVKKYPTLAKIIEHVLPLYIKNYAARDNWISNMGFDDKQAGISAWEEMLTYGKGPWITPTMTEKELTQNGGKTGLSLFLGRFGDGSGNEWGKQFGYADNISFESFNLSKLEAALKVGNDREVVFNAFRTMILIMHEAGHWVRSERVHKQDRINGRGEDGARAEEAVFGRRFSYTNNLKDGVNADAIRDDLIRQASNGARGIWKFMTRTTITNSLRKLPTPKGQIGDPVLKDAKINEGKIFTPESTGKAGGGSSTKRSKDYSYDY